MDVWRGDPVLGKPTVDRADGVVENRLGGIAGDQHCLPAFGRRSARHRPWRNQRKDQADRGEEARQQSRHRGHDITKRPAMWHCFGRFVQ